MKKSVLFILFALVSVAGFSQITGWNAKVGTRRQDIEIYYSFVGKIDLPEA